MQESRRKFQLFRWDEARIEALRSYWADGLSASQIAGRFGNLLTRNAVIGKVHRLGLSGPAKTTRKDAKPQRNTFAKRRKAFVIEQASRQRAALPTFEGQPIPEPRDTDIPRVFSVADLEPHHCKWIVGDPKQPGWGYCGAHQAGVPTLPYCGHHVTRARLDVAPTYVPRITGKWWSPHGPEDLEVKTA